MNCTIPGVCSHSSECKDRLCPGHPHMATRRVFWMEEQKEEQKEDEDGEWVLLWFTCCVAALWLVTFLRF